MNLNAFLLIDAGNTRLKWTVSERPGCEPVNVAAGSGEIATAKVNPQTVGALAKRFGRHYVILSSVVPEVTALFARRFKTRVRLVQADTKELGFGFNYPNPAEIGADRLAAAVAAHETAQWPVIIVSCGTATAFSVLDATGRFCGGAIAPGLQAQLAALLGATAQLPETTVGKPQTALAKSTREAIRAGVMLNFQGGANYIIQQLSTSLKIKRPHLILTGGYAAFLAEALELPHTLRPLLIFDGLRIIGNRVWNATP